jgi:hypothetical protein
VAETESIALVTLQYVCINAHGNHADLTVCGRALGRQREQFTSAKGVVSDTVEVTKKARKLPLLYLQRSSVVDCFIADLGITRLWYRGLKNKVRVAEQRDSRSSDKVPCRFFCTLSSLQKCWRLYSWSTSGKISVCTTVFSHHDGWPGTSSHAANV